MEKVDWKKKYKSFLKSAEKSGETTDVTFYQFKIDFGAEDVGVQDMTADELIQEFKEAVEDLPGTGARGRSRYYDVESEVKKRLDQIIETLEK